MIEEIHSIYLFFWSCLPNNLLFARVHEIKLGLVAISKMRHLSVELVYYYWSQSINADLNQPFSAKSVHVRYTGIRDGTIHFSYAFPTYTDFVENEKKKKKKSKMELARSIKNFQQC